MAIAGTQAGAQTPPAAGTDSVPAVTQIAYLKASNSEVGDLLGFAVGLSGDGDTLAVAAYLEDEATRGVRTSEPQPLLIVPNLDPWRSGDNRAEESGAVYLYTRTGGQWTERSYVKASNADAGDEFGSAVTLSGDGALLVVAAHQEDSAARGTGGARSDDSADDSADDSGAAYVFSHMRTP